MKRNFLCFFIFISLIFFSFAGDAAVFVDIGFSDDGNTYIFGEYGKTDKTFRGWANIYTVDVEKNIFIKSALFSTEPSNMTSDKSGKEVYNALVAKSDYATKKYNAKQVNADQILYLCGNEEKNSSDEILFKDFSGNISDKSTYSINLLKTINGTGENARSSFFIMMERRDASGNVVSRQKIGSPEITRKGVVDYKIEKIFCDKSGKSIIFVISKTIEDKTGVSIRYMVEAAKLTTSYYSAK